MQVSVSASDSLADQKPPQTRAAVLCLLPPTVRPGNRDHLLLCLCTAPSTTGNVNILNVVTVKKIITNYRSNGKTMNTEQRSADVLTY